MPPTIITVTLHPTIDRVIIDGGGGAAPTERLFAARKGVNVSRALARLGIGSACLALCPEQDRAFFEADLARLSGFPGRVSAVEFIPIPVGGRVRRHRTVPIGPGDHFSGHEPEAGTGTVEATDADLQRLAALLRPRLVKGALVAFCGSLPPGVSAAAFGGLLDEATHAGAQVLVDARGEAGIVAASRPLWVLKGNSDELESVHRAVGTTGARFTVITHGGGGLVVAHHGLTPLLARVSLPPSNPAVDDVGCGDAVTAGVLASWTQNPGNLNQMARWGVAAGTASAAALGPGELDPFLFKRLVGVARADTKAMVTLIRRAARE